MGRIALSLELLNQLEYHWFFGVRKASGNKKSIGTEVSELIVNEEKRAALSERVMSILALSVLYRLLFWICKSSYRKDYYLLSAYKSYDDYKERWRLLPNTDQKTAKKRGWYYTRSVLLNPDDFWFERRIEILLAKNTIQLSLETTEKYSEAVILSAREQEGIKQTLFFSRPLSYGSERGVVPIKLNNHDSNSDDVLIHVTQELSAALSILGIELVTGDSICLSQVVKAYKQQALKKHPDKNQSLNAHEEFIAINAAYQILLEEVKKKLTPASSDYSKDDFCDEQYKYVDNLFRELQDKVERYTKRVDRYIERANDLIKDVKTCAEESKKCAEESKKCAEESKKCAEDVKIFAKDVKNLAEDVKNLAEDVKNLAEDAKKYEEQTDKYLERADQFLEESAAFFKLAENYFQAIGVVNQIQPTEEKNLTESVSYKRTL